MSKTTTSNIPQHVGIILDGNRRWARQHNLPVVEGHRRGSDNFGDVIKHLFNQGVLYISAFVFSTENWKRTEEEVKYLMKLVIRYTEERLKEFNEAGIRMVVLGSREGLTRDVLQAVERVERETADNTEGTLALCFNYGGHEEIVHAVKKIVEQGTKPDDITEEAVEQALYHPDIPALDLVIRTSGEQRISGFMLHRAAYAELYFTDTYWPDITSEDMDKALEAYASRQRRYGA